MFIQEQVFIDLWSLLKWTTQMKTIFNLENNVYLFNRIVGPDTNRK